MPSSLKKLGSHFFLYILAFVLLFSFAILLVLGVQTKRIKDNISDSFQEFSNYVNEESKDIVNENDNAFIKNYVDIEANTFTYILNQLKSDLQYLSDSLTLKYESYDNDKDYYLDIANDYIHKNKQNSFFKDDNKVKVFFHVGVDKNDDDFERSMHELKELTKALDLVVAATVTQSLPSPDRSTYIGSGKVEEIKNSLDVFDANIIIFNDALSPMQVRNLEKILDTEVMDRTGLILQIFAKRARTREARLQVEYAQLQYMLPRLVGMRSSLSRQGGGSGRLSNKGSGEKQLELDRRRIEQRSAELRRELKAVEKERDTQRGRRLNSDTPKISLVGYTNAGKSTIMNNLLKYYGGETSVEKQVLEKNMLFATLDTSVRKISPSGHKPFLLTDTVGFISELPHTLVNAFKSTLEEAKYADLILEIIDFSDPEYRFHMDVTRETLAEIGAGDVPVLYVFNKSDIVQKMQEEASQLVMTVPRSSDDRVYICAKEKDSLDELISVIEKKLKEGDTLCTLILPYSEGAVLNALNESANIESTEYLPEGIKLAVHLSSKNVAKYSCYRVL